MTARRAPRWRKLFLMALAEVPVVQHACDAAGVSRSTVYESRAGDPAFAKAWDAALEAGVDRAEAEAIRRAVTGFDEPVVYQGRMMMVQATKPDGLAVVDLAGAPVMIPVTVRRYSDTLLALILKGRRKSVYSERTELAGDPKAPVQVSIESTAVEDDARRAARITQILAAAEARLQAQGEANSHQQPEGT
ncbi:MAG TPA: terminase [Burkholderiaceae bacterium]